MQVVPVNQKPVISLSLSEYIIAQCYQATVDVTITSYNAWLTDWQKSYTSVWSDISRSGHNGTRVTEINCYMLWHNWKLISHVAVTHSFTAAIGRIENSIGIFNPNIVHITLMHIWVVYCFKIKVLLLSVWEWRHCICVISGMLLIFSRSCTSSVLAEPK